MLICLQKKYNNVQKNGLIRGEKFGKNYVLDREKNYIDPAVDKGIWVVRPESFRPILGVGRFGLGRWVISANFWMSRFSPELFLPNYMETDQTHQIRNYPKIN